ncbi:MAG: hypothetical protein JSV79_00940 [Armatimonadota bacterium]|nr:MAG: hypothetical protein JSV79_00940 [Armatimonadota bacterium]
MTAVYLCRDFSGTTQVDKAKGKEAAFFAIEDIPIAISPPIRLIIDYLRRRYDEIVAGG